MQTDAHRFRTRMMVGVVVAVLLLSGLWAGPHWRAQAAEPLTKAPPAKHGHVPSELAGDIILLRKALAGNIDLYFDSTQVQAGKPVLVGVRFVDIVDVVGKYLLRFENDKEQWLVAPDSVVAFRTHKGS